MSNSVNQDRHGPDWPLGFIAVVTPGTPVGLTSLVDPSDVNDPEKPTPGTSGAAEYTTRAQQIIFQSFKPGAAHGVVNNTGNIYIVRDLAAGGSGNRDDYGGIVAILTPGQTFVLASAPLDRNVFNPDRYAVDADNAGDGVFVTLIIQ